MLYDTGVEAYCTVLYWNIRDCPSLPPSRLCFTCRLSVCLLTTSRINYLSDLRQNFTRDVSLDKKMPINFGINTPGGGLRSLTARVDLVRLVLVMCLHCRRRRPIVATGALFCPLSVDLAYMRDTRNLHVNFGLSKFLWHFILALWCRLQTGERRKTNGAIHWLLRGTTGQKFRIIKQKTGQLMSYFISPLKRRCLLTLTSGRHVSAVM